MEIRWLRAEDYDELLSMLNSVFENKYKRAVDFLTEQPKMWVRDDLHMGMHIGAFDGDVLAAVVGMYPLPTVIGGVKCDFYTTGNVATRPEYEGQGLFSLLFAEVMKRCDEVGACAARLGGARQRYGRFGFEPIGASYSFELNGANVIKCIPESGIEFYEVLPEDSDGLEFIRKLMRNKQFYVDRYGDRDLYLALGSKHSRPYIATRGGVKLGYLTSYADAQYVGASVLGRHIAELGAISDEAAVEMLGAWQRYTEKSVTVSLAPHQCTLIEKMAEIAEGFSISSPSRFRILDYERLADALMKLKDSYRALPEGDATLGIEGYGVIKLYKNKLGVGAELIDGEAEVTVDRSVASRMLFATSEVMLPSSTTEALRRYLPLPLSWNTNDYV